MLEKWKQNLEDKTPWWGLGGWFLLNIGKGEKKEWSLASNTRGVTANTAGLCPSSPDSDFFYGPPTIIMAFQEGGIVLKLQCKFIVKIW